MSAADGVAGLEHLLVLSDDIDRAADFYVQALGLRVGDRPPFEFTGYWLYAGRPRACTSASRASYREHAAKMGIEVPDRLDGRGPVDHIAFGASTTTRSASVWSGPAWTRCATTIPGGGPRQLFFDDPDGIRIEINVRAKAGGDD